MTEGLDAPCSKALSKVWQADPLSKEHDVLHKQALSELKELMEDEDKKIKVLAITAFTRLHKIQKDYELGIMDVAVKARIEEIKVTAVEDLPWMMVAIEAEEAAQKKKAAKLSRTSDPDVEPVVPSGEPSGGNHE